MPDSAVSVRSERRFRVWQPGTAPRQAGRAAWMPVWSPQAAMRALRATIVESTALRALAGTVVGFVAGAALLLAIGTGATALWVVLPIAVFVASYAPGTAPFLVGQAAFTITVVVLFNLLAPAGWKVGLLRIEDVAIGCAVSLVVGVLFWPRGAAAVVGDDLADAFHRGAEYLSQAVDWALGLRMGVPDTAVAAVTAGIRLDDALRGYLAEQGAKRVTKEDLWSLVMATMRVRLTANSLAVLCGTDRRPSPGARHRDGTNADGMKADGTNADVVLAALRMRTELAGFYERVAAQVGRPGPQEPAPLAAPVLQDLDPPGDVVTGAGPRLHQHLLWVREHLLHLGSHAGAIVDPALRLAQQRRLPWWR